MTTTDKKYLVFKVEDMENWIYQIPPTMFPTPSPEPLKDAVVIRTQDVFAEHGLRAYAGAVITAMDILEQEAANSAEWCSKEHAAELRLRIKDLQRIADYFNDKADEARAANGKVPD